MKPRILVTRAVPAQVLERLRQHFDVDANVEDAILTPAQLIQQLQGKQGALTTGSERIDAELLAACPELRVVANMAVGYNNFDIAACTARGVLATNTPDVLTETTADFGFALMMATARRMAESEHFLRRGEWKKWRCDMFTGSDVHGATLGILGMGRIGQAHRPARRAGLRHEGDLSQPQPTRARARGPAGRALGRQGHAAARSRPPGAGAAVLGGQPPRHRRGRAGADEAHRDADQHRARRHRRRRRAGRRAARAPHRGGGAGRVRGRTRGAPGLLAVPNVVLTPHIASASVATRIAMADLAADNLIAALTGGTAPTPINAADLPPRG